MIIAEWQAEMLFCSPPFSQTTSTPWEMKPIVVDRDDLSHQDLLSTLPWVDRYRILELLMARTYALRSLAERVPITAPVVNPAPVGTIPAVPAAVITAGVVIAGTVCEASPRICGVKWAVLLVLTEVVCTPNTAPVAEVKVPSTAVT